MLRSLRFIALVTVAIAATGSARAADPQLGHMVFFTLKEDNAANRQKLISACQKHLTGHEGLVYFSVGEIADDLNRDVNDREFDVALHLVFANKAAHDKYQDHPRHQAFIDSSESLWEKVRVFDSYLAPVVATPAAVPAR